MSNGHTIDNLNEMLNSVTNDEISRRVLAVMILTNTETIEKLKKEILESLENTHTEILDSVAAIDLKVDTHMVTAKDRCIDVTTHLSEIQEDLDTNLTLFTWIKTNKKKSSLILVMSILISNLWFISGLRYWTTVTLLQLLNLPNDTIDQIILLLFN